MANQDEKQRATTPLTLLVTRLLFVGYFVLTFFAIQSPPLPYSQLSYPWLAYLVLLYIGAEKAYSSFKRKNIDLGYAFPLLFAMYILNGTTEILGGQELFPLLNRAEHLSSYIFLAYVIWTFFTKYLPQDVWRKHPYYTATLVFSVTLAFGVVNEIVELLFDTLFGTKLIGKQLDTSIDLLMNTLGAGLFLAVRLIIGTTEKSFSSQEK